MQLKIKRLDPGLPLPRYARAGDAGLDLYAAADTVIQPQRRCMIPCGIAIALPDGYAGFVQPRSGLARERGLTFVNTPGLVDAGYRGELIVIAHNTDPGLPITIKRGERIAQLVIQRVETADIVEVDELDETERGTAGFGSTGV
ncbi:MAG: dUTP diphosphatase [Actinomycetes bacterium]|jgi:dUTP pyrophosphatase|nr:dUTP diphosphatase [Actinomycetes bacterium]